GRGDVRGFSSAGIPAHGHGAHRHGADSMNTQRRHNFLVLMVDQLTGTLFDDGPASFLHVPNLARLAGRSTRFANCYTPSPLCVPARAAFMSAQLPSRSGVYDNAAEFPASVPTFAHYL